MTAAQLSFFFAAAMPPHHRCFYLFCGDIDNIYCPYGGFLYPYIYIRGCGSFLSLYICAGAVTFYPYIYMRGRGCFLSLYICAVAGAFYPYIYALIYSTTYIYFCTKKPPKQAAAELFCEIVVNLHCVYQVNGYAGKKSVSNKKAQTAI